MRAASGPVEWLTFPAPGDDTHQFRVDVSFLLSTYRCIFGCGCPGLLDVHGPRADVGCCENGAEFVDDEDFDHVAAQVERLTAADADNIARIERGRWFTTKGKRAHKTSLAGGMCVFANRADGPAGKPGCAFHHLAERVGEHPADTKPDICWRVPLNYSHEEPIEPNGRDTTIVSAFTADSWGGELGWWCVDSPEAFSGSEPAYRTFEYELRKGIGDAAYERLAELLEQIGTPRFPAPGQLRGQRLPLIS